MSYKIDLRLDQKFWYTYKSENVKIFKQININLY